MLKPAVMTVLLLLGPSGFAADKIEPLEGAFLDYLANLEGDDDDWTLLAEAGKSPPPATPSKDRPAKPDTASKEAANPAVDER